MSIKRYWEKMKFAQIVAQGLLISQDRQRILAFMASTTGKATMIRRSFWLVYSTNSFPNCQISIYLVSVV